MYGATLKVPPMKVRKDWYIGLDIPGVVANMHLNQYGRNLLQHQENEEIETIHSLANSTTSRKLLQREKETENKETSKIAFQGLEGYLTDEGIESFEIFLPSETPSSYVSHIRNQKDPLYSSTYNFIAQSSSDYLFIDPHVLATPVIVDLDRDGKDEIIVPVSYFFDKYLTSEIDDNDT